MRTPALALVGLLTGALGVNDAASPRLARVVPRPFNTHPGNVFLADESVRVPVPAAEVGDWQLHDYDDQPVVKARPADGHLKLGALRPGFYRLRPAGVTTGTNWISLAVLPPLRAPTPLTSPIGLDVAMAWFYPPEKMDAVANLCVLAGVNWVRDRLHWGQMEPERGRFTGPGKYDAAAAAQTRAGLQVLQVIHLSPPWANPDTKRFPLDLRDAHRFYREMARRWTGEVQAFEPWNEPDIEAFGGHTGAEIASLQKTAWLGLKAGNPRIRVPLAVFALHHRAPLSDLQANQAWPYFDTFNLHHYEPFENYPGLYADFRAVSAGRPLWTTEAALPVKWAEEATKEPSDADLRVQSERVAKTYACALHERTLLFYFLLPHYVEGPTQFGIIRPDLTPRPAYVALAAVGRLLADAQPLGRVTLSGSQQGYLFRARPDGRTRDVLVAWDANGSSRCSFRSVPVAAYDHLGRERTPTQECELTTAPRFLVWPKGSYRRASLTLPPAPPVRLKGRPSPIVLQPLWPAEQTDLKQSAYQIRAGARTVVPVFAYNFSSHAVGGPLRVEAPADWRAEVPESLDLAAGARGDVPLVITAPSEPRDLPGTVRLTAEFKHAGSVVLSLRLVPRP